MEDCQNGVRARGWCTTHYARWGPQRIWRACKIKGCQNRRITRGWCAKHYQRWRQHSSTDLVKSPPRICKKRGCDEKARSVGYCKLHYMRYWRYGDPSKVKQKCHPAICTIDGCHGSTKGSARGWCQKHYARFLRHGSTETVKVGGVPRMKVPICRTCKTKLEVCVNWTNGDARNRQYICRSCHSTQAKKHYKTYPAHALLSRAKSRAADRGLPFDLTIEYVQDLVQSTPRCPALGIPIIYGGGSGPCDGSPSLDRFVGSKGYVAGNVAILSWKANTMKNRGSPEDMRRLAAWADQVERTGDYGPGLKNVVIAPKLIFDFLWHRVGRAEVSRFLGACLREAKP